MKELAITIIQLNSDNMRLSLKFAKSPVVLSSSLVSRHRRSLSLCQLHPFNYVADNCYLPLCCHPIPPKTMFATHERLVSLNCHLCSAMLRMMRWRRNFNCLISSFNGRVFDVNLMSMVRKEFFWLFCNFLPLFYWYVISRYIDIYFWFLARLLLRIFHLLLVLLIMSIEMIFVKKGINFANRKISLIIDSP